MDDINEINKQITELTAKRDVLAKMTDAEVIAQLRKELREMTSSRDYYKSQYEALTKHSGYSINWAGR